MLAGLLDTQADAVIAVYEKLGFTLSDRRPGRVAGPGSHRAASVMRG